MVVGVGVDGSAGELQALMAVLGRSMAMCRWRPDRRMVSAVSRLPRGFNFRETSWELNV